MPVALTRRACLETIDAQQYRVEKNKKRKALYCKMCNSGKHLLFKISKFKGPVRKILTILMLMPVFGPARPHIFLIRAVMSG